MSCLEIRVGCNLIFEQNPVIAEWDSRINGSFDTMRRFLFDPPALGKVISVQRTCPTGESDPGNFHFCELEAYGVGKLFICNR